MPPFPPAGADDARRTATLRLGNSSFEMEVAPSLPPPPERFDLAAAKAAPRLGPLSVGLAAGSQALAASRQALDQVAQGIAPDGVLKDWQGALPERTTAPAASGGAGALAARLDGALLPLLDGVRGELTRQALAQREREDQAAAVAWLNRGAALAASAPPALVGQVAQRIGAVLEDPGLGKLFQDKVAYYQARRVLERDAGHDLAADPRLAGVAPEILADLEVDRARLAQEQAAAGAAKLSGQRRDFGRALRQGHSDVLAGIAGPAYSRADFVRLYGEAEADKRLAAWLAAQAKAPAYALVRGRSPAEIATAKAGYAGDRTILAAIEAEDAAERTKDPAGYALRWLPGVQDSLARAAHEGQTGEELARLKADELWEAQAALGIAEARRSPWTLEESQAIARQWLAAEAQPAGLPRGEALVTLLREQVLSLPAEQRAGAIAALERQGLDARTPGRIRAALAALERGSLGLAYRAVDDGKEGLGAVGMRTAAGHQGSPRPAQDSGDEGGARPTLDGSPTDRGFLPDSEISDRGGERERSGIEGLDNPALEDPAFGGFTPEHAHAREREIAGKEVPAWKSSLRSVTDHWARWAAALDKAGVGDIQRFVMQEIFAAEGGVASDGTTVAGITQTTLNGLIEDWGLELPVGIRPKDLSYDQMVEFYRAYFAPNYGAFGFGEGFNALEAMGDEELAAAMADSLVRLGAKTEVIEEVLQGAIQQTFDAYPELEAENPSFTVDGKFGTSSTSAVRAIAASDEAKAFCLNAIRDAREVYMLTHKASWQKSREILEDGSVKVTLWPGEIDRIDHFRFQ